jgi:hypothetical protein
VKANGAPSVCSELITKVIKKWLAVFCTLAGKEPTRPLIDVWMELLAPVGDPAVLNAACEATARSWKIANTIPPPGEILSRIHQNVEEVRKLDAADAWMEARKLIEEHYYSDLGYRGPAMSAEMRRAIASAGGMHMIANCAESDLPWCQKRFIEYYSRALKVAESENLYLPQDADTRRLLTDFARSKSL